MPEARTWARLWDGPTRLFHWGMVALVGFCWWSGEVGRLEWHRWAGYGIVGLLVFRLIWGFAGSASARFASFVRGPAATLAYARGLLHRDRAELPGHNPLGGWSVLAMLATLVVQVVTGLFAVDVDGLESGPLSDRVSFDGGRQMAEWHELSFTVLQVLVALHIAAIVFYLTYKRSDLIRPMITGRARFASDPGLLFASLGRLLAAAAVAILAAWWIAKGLRL